MLRWGAQGRTPGLPAALPSAPATLPLNKVTW